MTLLSSQDGVRGAEALAHEMLAALGQPFEVGGMALEVNANVGLAVHPDHASGSHELLRCADVALHEAKRTGTRVTTYSERFDANTRERLAMMSELGAAVQSGELKLHLQPQIALDTGLVAGFEALVRWAHPRLGLLPPSRFLHLAETSDLIHPLTIRVVENALLQLRVWNDGGHDIQMAINLFVRNLLDRSCAQRVEEAIRRIGVDPARVELELTETAVMTDPPTALEVLQRIAATGVRLAVDDFGTGYSSLTYLRRFPIQTLKVDQSFVCGMLSDPQNHAIVSSTLQLARSLGLQTVGEGVEDRQTVDALREMGCDLAQGYFFAPPVPPEDVAHRLSLDNRWQHAEA